MGPIDEARNATGVPEARARPCPHYPRCAGCALIGRPYGEQLRWKQQRIEDLFAAEAPLLRPEILPIVGSPRAFGYRNQAKLVLRRASRGLLAGLYKVGTHQVVDVRCCPVHADGIRTVLARGIPLLEESGIPTYDERKREGTLRYLIVRWSSWQKAAQVILVTATPLDPALRALLRRASRLPRVKSVVHDYNPEPGNVLLAHRFSPIAGRGELIERVGPCKIRTQAGTFLQANVSVARRIYEYATEEAAPSREGVVVDLYCGAGAWSLYLATRARLVIGVEAGRSAVVDAKANVRLNGFSNLRFVHGETQEVLPSLVAEVPGIEVVTVNPPRKGLDAGTRHALAALAPSRVVYVSCSPVSLVRDLRWLAEHGYRVCRVRPFDLMPQTDHIECVATLEKVGDAGA